MRQITLQVPHGEGEELVAMARELGAATLSRLEGSGGDGEPVEVIVATVPNVNVGPLVERAHELGRIEASLPATGAFAFEPPVGKAAEELTDVTPRSGFEVVLAGRQSAGSWQGFLTYAAVAGIVVWLGLYNETIYLLTGSMLIAPFAGPAMNTAIAMNAGDGRLLRHSVLRYLVGIGATAAASMLLTVIVRQHVVTELTVDVLTVTAVAVLLPLAAGVAGATFLAQSEHSSLISGAAVGILVAASLAPPAGGLGIAVALGRWELVAHAAFLIALQLAGITASAIVVLWCYGVRPGSSHFTSERPTMLRIGLAVATVAAMGLVALQLVTAPALVQTSAARDAAELIADVVEADGRSSLLQVQPDVASSDLPGPPRLLVDVVVEQATDEATTPEALQAALDEELRRRLRRTFPDTVAHLRLTVLPAPPDAAATG